jgi:RND family efflux transporter MFP subunit
MKASDSDTIRPMEEAQHSHVPTRYSSGTGRWLGIGVLVLAFLLCAAFWYAHHRNKVAAEALATMTADAAEEAAPVDVIRAGYGSNVSELELPGEARAWYSSTIYARVSGYVGKWDADMGDKVAKGQVLAQLQTPELDDQLKAAEAKVAADKSLIAVAESNQSFADAQNKRYSTAPKGVVPLQSRDEKNADYQSSIARLGAARAQVELDNAEVNRLKDFTGFKNVTAPYDGIITARHIDIGDLVTAGSTSGNAAIYDIVKADKIRVFVDVPQSASAQITLGMPAVATVAEYGNREFAGKVARTADAIDPIAKTLRVEVDIENSDLALKPGTYLVVHFKANVAHPSVQVPAAALTFRSGSPQVAVVDADGKVHFHDIAIARDMGSFVEVASGIAAGDRVALNISNQINDGDKVQATGEDEPANPQSGDRHVALSEKLR